MAFSDLNLAQKILYIVLIILIIWMVFWSFKYVPQYTGKSGYDKCIQEKCEIDEVWCKSQREISNCCNGAKGRIAFSGSELTCVF